jgi:hypothetical protein
MANLAPPPFPHGETLNQGVEYTRGTLPTPILDEGGVQLYGGYDARELLPLLQTDPTKTVICVDPIWPDAPKGMFKEAEGPSAAKTLLGELAAHWPRLARRALVQLGDGSDPRMLAVIPPELPYYRTCWLRYASPLPRAGRLLSGDVVHVFGRRDVGVPLPPAETTLRGRRAPSSTLHPCPRDEGGVKWLLWHYTRPGDLVIDPCAGSGTTLRAAAALGRRAIGIELRAGYAREALELFLRARAAGELWPEAAAGTFGGPRVSDVEHSERSASGWEVVDPDQVVSA